MGTIALVVNEIVERKMSGEMSFLLRHTILEERCKLEEVVGTSDCGTLHLERKEGEEEAWCDGESNTTNHWYCSAELLAADDCADRIRPVFRCDSGRNEMVYIRTILVQ